MTVPGYNQTLHASVRLQIAALLSRVYDAEFATVRDIVGVSDSVLSKHLSALAGEGYVRLRKASQGGRQRTWVSLSGTGRAAFNSHLAALQAMIDNAQAAASTTLQQVEC